MQEHFESHIVAGDADWLNFAERLIASATAPEKRSDHLSNALALFRQANAKHAIIESFYIDRDFSASNSSFYSTLFQPFNKLCRRVHFFSEPFDPEFMTLAVDQRANDLEQRASAYLGHLVLRPVKKAPVSSSILSAEACERTLSAKIPIQGDSAVHLMGARLGVCGAAATEQDSRVGACAQAALWTIGRHIHHKHKGAWYSVPKITELALSQLDQSLAWDVPAGSTALSLDAMIRAVRSMDRHPLLVAPDDKDQWSVSPQEVIWQYLDSKIPVIIGLDGKGDTIDHVVVAIGVENGPMTVDATGKMLGAGAKAFIVHDDQSGPCTRLPVSSTDDMQINLADCSFILIPMPEKVFSSAGDADLIARDTLRRLVRRRVSVSAVELETEWDESPPFAELDRAFAEVVENDTVVSRTYLTHGWSYQARAIRSDMHAEVRTDVANSHFPRFVWVSEFYLPDSCRTWPPGPQSAIAEVVIDATGNVPLLIDIPGLAAVYHFDVQSPGEQGAISWFPTHRAIGLGPKPRGAV